MRFSLLFFSAILLLSFSCTDEKKGSGKVEPVAVNSVNEAIIITKTKSGITDTTKKSLKAYVKNKIATADFTINYYSPAVRGRVIWGGLVPYDEVWVTGAHAATILETDRSFYIGNKLMPAGKFAIFTIPAKDEWTFILNSNWDQHLADEYDEKEDMLRIKIKPDSLDYVQERLMYDINQRSQKEGDIFMIWERVKLRIPVSVSD